MGEGRVDGIGVRRPPEGEARRLIISTLDRLFSFSSGPGLNALLRGADCEGGEAWFDDTELRW